MHEIVFHPGYCHMQPWVLAAIAAWAEDARSRGEEILVRNAERAAYAWRFGLHDFLGIERPTTVHEHEEAGRFLQLRRVSTTADVGNLVAEVVPLLHLGGSPETAKALQYALSEMVRNTLEHSQEPRGAVVAAQYYPGNRSSRKYVSVGIADTGQGIAASLRNNYEVPSDVDALLMALRPGVSGARRGAYGASDNAGAGLFITRKIVEATGGYFGIASGHAAFKSSLARRRPSDLDLAVKVGGYPGTLVAVEIGLGADLDYDSVFRLARAAFGQEVRRTETVESKVRFT